MLRRTRGEVAGVSVGLPVGSCRPAGLGIGNANVGDSDGDAAGDLPEMEIAPETTSMLRRETAKDSRRSGSRRRRMIFSQ